jgi:predicted O-methyltransferase YrrM
VALKSKRSSAQLISEARQIGLQQIDREISALIAFLLSQQRNNVLEIGSAEGGSFYLWCQLFSGKKISLDYPTGNYGGIGMTAARKRNREFKTWSQDVHGILDDSHSMRAREKVARCLGGKKLDFLFIDGDHSLLGVRLDYFMYREFVRPGGYIAFHDINGSRWHHDVGCLVSRFWSELKGEKQEFNSHRDWGGIGLLKVSS